jgi:hypothetical protein
MCDAAHGDLIDADHLGPGLAEVGQLSARMYCLSSSLTLSQSRYSFLAMSLMVRQHASTVHAEFSRSDRADGKDDEGRKTGIPASLCVM